MEQALGEGQICVCVKQLQKSIVLLVFFFSMLLNLLYSPLSSYGPTQTSRCCFVLLIIPWLCFPHLLGLPFAEKRLSHGSPFPLAAFQNI